MWDFDGRDGGFHIALAMHPENERCRSVRECVDGSRADPARVSTSFLSRLLSALFGGSRNRRGGVEPPYLPASALRIPILARQRSLAE
ncbi:MAG: hypothetical protein GXY82_03635 [Methanospirillum sp.]|nr:hypothetical protein [Methanospirillum sp.]